MAGTPEDKRRSLRDWIDPFRLYDPRIPAERFIFLWGLAIFPAVVIFLLLTVILIGVETVSPNFNSDYLGILVWFFMLGWVVATLLITLRRLLRLKMSPRWVWLAILPIVNLPLFLGLSKGEQKQNHRERQDNLDRCVASIGDDSSL